MSVRKKPISGRGRKAPILKKKPRFNLRLGKPIGEPPPVGIRPLERKEAETHEARGAPAGEAQGGRSADRGPPVIAYLDSEHEQELLML